MQARRVATIDGMMGGRREETFREIDWWFVRAHGIESNPVWVTRRDVTRWYVRALAPALKGRPKFT